MASLRAQTLAPDEVIVVDNGSTDGTLDWLQAQTGITLLSNPTNLGFAAANNQGISHCSGELVILLNYDVELAPDYLELCSRHFRQADVGSVTGKLLRPGGGIVDSAGHNVYGLGWAENRGELGPDSGYDTSEEVFGVCAAAALYRRVALDRVAVGGEFLDESYFSYIEDVDLDWRLRWMGWRAWYEPGAVAIHHRSATGARFSPAIMRHILANRIITVVKNYDGRMLARHGAGILAFTVTKTLDFGRTHPSAVLGLGDAARLFPRALRWRRALRARHSAEPAAVAAWLRPFPWLSRARRRLAPGGSEPGSQSSAK
jgi:GT2 family glycosyltransferase